MSAQCISTRNYSQFKNFDQNRPIVAARVDELKLSISKRNKLHLHPIVVARTPNNLAVIDGQHRLEAARQLQLPIWYFIDEDHKLDDMILLNTHRHSWLLRDYVYYHHKCGKPDYILLQNWIKFAEGFGSNFTSVYNSLRVISLKATSAGDVIRDGTMILKNKDVFDSFLKITLPLCVEINKLINKYSKKLSLKLFFKSPYIRVLASCYRTMTLTQYREMWECIKRDYKTFTDTNSTSEIVKNLDSSFNKKKSVAKFDFDLIKHYIEIK